MASLSCVKLSAASVTSGRCWFHSALLIYFIIYLFRLFRLLWFYCHITDICEIRTVKIKKHTNKKTLLTPILQKRKYNRSAN